MIDHKDYYFVLGVLPDATAKSIKTAYRRLAKRYHPDVTVASPENHQRFLEVGEAYEKLHHRGSRSDYDHHFLASVGSLKMMFLQAILSTRMTFRLTLKRGERSWPKILSLIKSTNSWKSCLANCLSTLGMSCADRASVRSSCFCRYPRNGDSWPLFYSILDVQRLCNSLLLVGELKRHVQSIPPFTWRQPGNFGSPTSQKPHQKGTIAATVSIRRSGSIALEIGWLPATILIVVLGLGYVFGMNAQRQKDALVQVEIAAVAVQEVKKFNANRKSIRDRIVGENEVLFSEKKIVYDQIDDDNEIISSEFDQASSLNRDGKANYSRVEASDQTNVLPERSIAGNWAYPEITENELPYSNF